MRFTVVVCDETRICSLSNRNFTYNGYRCVEVQHELFTNVISIEYFSPIVAWSCHDILNP